MPSAHLRPGILNIVNTHAVQVYHTDVLPPNLRCKHCDGYASRHCSSAASSPLDTEAAYRRGPHEIACLSDCDDVFYEAVSKRLYARGGAGIVSVFEQQNPDQSRELARIPTRNGARTSFFSSESCALYVVARQQGSNAIYVYRVHP